MEPSEANLQSPGELSFTIPESIATTKATKKNLSRIQEKKFLEHVEPMLDEFYQILRFKLRRGDSHAIKIVQEVLGLSPAKGPSVVAQFYNKNEANAAARAEAGATSMAGGGHSFEDIVKRLESRETQISKASDFIEVEVDN